MCPERAKVFIAEDDENFRKFDREAVTKAGHEVAIEVEDVEDGLQAVGQAKELGVNVALLDGRIPSFPNDGATLAAALREVIPGIKVVDVSAFGDAIADADAKMPKTKFSIKELGELVTKL